ncbi:GL19943 [Drosophila persimilis]|uniref:GL19943 n=1 Tax=Drosophila persimilis TaxID=7234 RepID=B4GYL0_DROPE|nr:GL19943 [Drosophila persimilis]
MPRMLQLHSCPTASCGQRRQWTEMEMAMEMEMGSDGCPSEAAAKSCMLAKGSPLAEGSCCRRRRRRRRRRCLPDKTSNNLLKRCARCPGISKSGTSKILASDDLMDQPPQKKRRVSVIPLPELADMEQPSQHRRRRSSLPNFGRVDEFSTRPVENLTIESAIPLHLHIAHAHAHAHAHANAHPYPHPHPLPPGGGCHLNHNRTTRTILLFS